MANTEEVAVFIDFENLRYSLLNRHGLEPSAMAVVEKAKKYGRPSVMKAYADFTEHPQPILRQLQVAGIDAINVPVKRSIQTKEGKQIERIRNAADMGLALDAILEALEADNLGKKKVFILVTGDADYVKLVALLKNRFGQRVIIAGVPETIAGDLISAAGESDPIEVPPKTVTDKVLIKKALVGMVKKGPAPLKYWSLKIIDQWAQSPHQKIPGNAAEKRDAIGELCREDVFVKKPAPSGSATQTVLDEGKAKTLGYL